MQVDLYNGLKTGLLVFCCLLLTPWLLCVLPVQVGEILNDERRLNVAVTRARHKLVFIGSASGLRCYAPVDQLLSHILQPCHVSLTLLSSFIDAVARVQTAEYCHLFV